MKFYYLIHDWIFLLLNVKKIAIQLDNCLRQLGQMRHNEGNCPHCDKRINSPGVMLMDTKMRHELINQSYPVLPKRRWRNN